jgi:DNA repair protein RadC
MRHVIPIPPLKLYLFATGHEANKKIAHDKHTEHPIIQPEEGTFRISKQRIRSSLEAYEFIKQFYSDDIEIYESFFILLLNQGNYTIGFAKISQGGIAGTVVDTRMVAKIALESLAVNIILAHNHPSGNLNPSAQDKSLTERITNGLKLLDINVADHIILTAESYFSFRDECMM